MQSPYLVYFLYNFVLRYFIALPFLIHNLVLAFFSKEKSIIHLAFLGLLSLSLLKLLWLEKIDLEFFKAPVVTIWNRNLPKAKSLLNLKFVFDDRPISRGEFYLFNGLLIITAFLSLYILSIKFFDVDSLLVSTFLLLTIGGSFFFIGYLPAWKLIQKHENRNLEKPFWYWFSYNIHYKRQKRFFDDAIAPITKKNGLLVSFFFIIFLILIIDWFCGSPMIIKITLTYLKMQKTLLDFFRFLEIAAAYICLGEFIKCLYVDQLVAEAKHIKDPTQ